MNYADIKPCDMNNGEGLVVSLWVSGCPFKCEGCHNSIAWDKDFGKPFTDETKQYLFDLLSDTRVDLGLSILGGEPLAPYNYITILGLVKEVKQKFPNKKIWLWTGYSIHQIRFLSILDYVDVIVDGQYQKDHKDETTWWRGSTNQNMYEIKHSDTGVECLTVVQA